MSGPPDDTDPYPVFKRIGLNATSPHAEALDECPSLVLIRPSAAASGQEQLAIDGGPRGTVLTIFELTSVWSWRR